VVGNLVKEIEQLLNFKVFAAAIINTSGLIVKMICLRTNVFDLDVRGSQTNIHLVCSADFLITLVLNVVWDHFRARCW